VERKRDGDNRPFINRHRPVVSVIIVNFNAGPLLSKAVESALSSSITVEVFVSDNGSTDGSLLSLRGLVGVDTRIHIIENRRNLGFARANNIVLKQAQGEYILLLNPDAVIKPDTLARMLEAFAAYPEAGIAGCLLRNPDGTEQIGCRRSIPTPWRSLVRVLRLGKLSPGHPLFRNFLLIKEPLPEKPIFLEAISGAFMLVRREALEQVGLMDEGYFLHCEDLDWCMRFRQAGWQILFVPHVEVTHYKGTCSKNRPIWVMFHMHRGMTRLYRKFFQRQYSWPLMLLIIAGVWTRFLLLAVRMLIEIKWQKISKSVNGYQDRVSLKPTAETKPIKPKSINSNTNQVVDNHILVISDREAKRPYSQLL
jgi:GT2 family glycosyltransferase